MLSAIGPVRSLLAAIFLLMAGAGFISTLVGLRLEALGRAPLAIGAVTAAYFVGLTLGSLGAGRVIGRVGHIRAFAAFVSVLSASTLSYSLHQGTTFWAGLRLLDGLCVAGVYVCLESWLADRAEGVRRGAVLAAYMIALYTGQAVGQQVLHLGATAPAVPFILASILISLAIVPIVLTRGGGPSVSEQRAMRIAQLYRTSPLGLVGVGVIGVVLGAFYGLGAVFVRQLGADVSWTALFMSAVIAGGVALQWPLGWLSDRLDRRRVIVGAFACAAATCAAIALAGGPGARLLLLGAVFGGLTFALYPLCVAHTNDHLDAGQRVGASGGLVLVYSLGAALGPLVGAGALSVFGPAGLFWAMAALAAASVAFALWRLLARGPVPASEQQNFQALPRTTPMSAALDPLSPDQG